MSCPICARGAPLPGYACVVAKRHVVEPFELPQPELAEFWRESMAVARALHDLYAPTKLNYEIHGNTIPHLRMHLLPRFAGDGAQASYTRSRDELDRLRRAVATLAAAHGRPEEEDVQG